MKVKVSKVFAKFINDTAKEMGFKCEAEVVTMSVETYHVYVDYDLIDAERYGDYDMYKGTAKAIRLDYPDDYCSMPRYLTTKELTKEFHSCHVQDVDGLKRMVRNMCEI